jgi:hypothetical protein
MYVWCVFLGVACQIPLYFASDMFEFSCMLLISDRKEFSNALWHLRRRPVIVYTMADQANFLSYFSILLSWKVPPPIHIYMKFWDLTLTINLANIKNYIHYILSRYLMVWLLTYNLHFAIKLIVKIEQYNMFVSCNCDSEIE